VIVVTLEETVTLRWDAWGRPYLAVFDEHLVLAEKMEP